MATIRLTTDRGIATGGFTDKAGAIEAVWATLSDSDVVKYEGVYIVQRTAVYASTYAQNTIHENAVGVDPTACGLQRLDYYALAEVTGAAKQSDCDGMLAIKANGTTFRGMTFKGPHTLARYSSTFENGSLININQADGVKIGTPDQPVYLQGAGADFVLIDGNASPATNWVLDTLIGKIANRQLISPVFVNGGIVRNSVFARSHRSGNDFEPLAGIGQSVQNVLFLNCLLESVSNTVWGGGTAALNGVTLQACTLGGGSTYVNIGDSNGHGNGVTLVGKGDGTYDYTYIGNVFDRTLVGTVLTERTEEAYSPAGTSFPLFAAIGEYVYLQSLNLPEVLELDIDTPGSGISGLTADESRGGGTWAAVAIVADTTSNFTATGKRRLQLATSNQMKPNTIAGAPGDYTLPLDNLQRWDGTLGYWSSRDRPYPGIAPTASATGSGTLNAHYEVCMTFVGAAGESMRGQIVPVNPVNQNIGLSSIQTGPTGTTARKVYVRNADVGSSDPRSKFRLSTTIADNSTTTATITTAPTGAEPEVVNFTDKQEAAVLGGTVVTMLAASADRYYASANEKFEGIRPYLLPPSVGGGALTIKYSKGAGVWGTLTVTDNTSGLTVARTSGVANTIDFTPPADWAKDTLTQSGQVPFDNTSAYHLEFSFASNPSTAAKYHMFLQKDQLLNALRLKITAMTTSPTIKQIRFSRRSSGTMGIKNTGNITMQGLRMLFRSNTQGIIGNHVSPGGDGVVLSGTVSNNVALNEFAGIDPSAVLLVGPDITSFVNTGIVNTGTVPPPSAPTNLQATAVADTSITVGWIDNALDEDVYECQRRLTSEAWGGASTVTDTLPANSTTDTFGGLAAGTSYTFRVRCGRSGVYSSYTPDLDVATSAAAIPAAPTNLQATSATTTTVSLGWADNATTETSYEVAWSPAGQASWTAITGLAADLQAYTVTGLTANTAYDFRVRCRNASGASGYSNTATFTTLASSPPNAPTSLILGGKNPIQLTSIAVRWTDNATDDTAYHLEYRVAGSGAYTVIDLAANTTQRTVSGLTSGTTYDFRVRCENSGTYSAYSNDLQVSTLSPAPPLPPPTVPTEILSASVRRTEVASTTQAFTVMRRRHHP